MQTWLQEVFSFLSIELTVMLTAAMPVIELRGAIPVGISLGLSPFHSAVISFIGSMLPVPVLLFTVRPLFNYLKQTTMFRKMVDRLIRRSLSKSSDIQKYGAWGLMLFVAVPLPGTGVWSGAIVAALLDMRFKLAFPAIFVGNIIAAAAIMLLSDGVVRILR